MRYYVYLSTAKVDMLYEQIPPKLLKRLAVEAKVDLKILSLAVQSPRAETSRYDRLDIVESYLERESDVGWMTEPTAWFRGDLALRIAGYGEVNKPTLMTGRDGDTVVALIGSAHHLVGYEAPPEMGRIGFSGLPSLFRLLQETPPEWESHFNVRSLGGRMPSRGGVAQDVLQAAEALTVPPVYCDFLARQLMRSTVTREDGEELTIVVGTPLYVAMSDQVHEGEGA
ncbi:MULTISPECIES: SAVMC3_10250 family protein [unclassified Streptomyces]|uniref:DUF7019 family protein n=1 Tax=Streptomyces TaxID=1883 RepID=UPI00136D7095|nr:MULTISPECIES: SAVMC3_10250 family protein [unclassified Streptomyces]NDZ98234.1 hypothetical protein [Streptomyces sp. SID10116]MYY86889.1 hypothetical protein [Streptomyces sp. SID335]MYZ11802.1 hypothetical protein [Streptomyces sp. SID337]NDZ88072.1 hypothetical protein [Streptomyces sp. SID10115]NEB47592.1 hypothetical protein [Streptomyces sp. SID339]